MFIICIQKPEGKGKQNLLGCIIFFFLQKDLVTSKNENSLYKFLTGLSALSFKT